MNVPFTNEDRQRGYREMQESLTPLVKALRRFAAGRPPEKLNNSPIGAVMLLTEQRKRLQKVLADEKVKSARVTSQGVVVRFTPPRPEPSDVIVVEEGKEGEAIQQLTEYGTRTKLKFVIAGIMFAVQHGKEKRPFAYLIERTPEGKAALEYSYNRQTQRVPRKSMS